MKGHDMTPKAKDTDAAAAQLPGTQEWAPGDESEGHTALEPPVGRVTPVTSGALAVPFSTALEQLLEPHTVDVITWARSLVTGAEYPETDAEEIGVGILAAILGADSSEAALTALDLERAKDLCGGKPGGHSPVLTITGARALKSTYQEGAPCYAIIKAVRKVDGVRIQFTTGARAVQAVVIAHIGNGWMPFDAMLEIREQPTERGFHPLNLVLP